MKSKAKELRVVNSPNATVAGRDVIIQDTSSQLAASDTGKLFDKIIGESEVEDWCFVDGKGVFIYVPDCKYKLLLEQEDDTRYGFEQPGVKNNYKPGPYRIDEDKVLDCYRDFYTVEKLYLSVDNVKIDVCKVLIIAGEFWAPLPWICKNPSPWHLYDKICKLLNNKIHGDYKVLAKY